MRFYRKNYSSICILALISILNACEISKIDADEIDPIYVLKLNPRLESNSEGFYQLKLDSSRTQTIHRISGQLLKNGEEPNPPEKVEWDSNLIWALNDTSYIIYSRVINSLGQWVIVDTSYVTNFEGDIVPTTNGSSYSGTNGEINTIIAPIYNMKGDTMILRSRFKELEKRIDIILK